MYNTLIVVVLCVPKFEDCHHKLALTRKYTQPDIQNTVICL
jgi:hypothetical protein